jgi:hypothetical protein
MEPKKTKKADLENKKGIFLQIGIIVVLGITLAAFEWSSKPNMENTLGELADMNLEEEIIHPHPRRHQRLPRCLILSRTTSRLKMN